MNDYQDNRNPDEIADDVERTRAELGETIDAIQHKLTPGQMMDQAFNYARTSLPADFGSNFGNAVRNNPLPVALIGIGIAWLATTGQNPRYSTARRSSADYEAYETDYAAAYGTDESAGDGEGRMQRAKSKMSETGNRISGKASEIGQRISETASSLTGRARGAGSRMQDSAGGARARMGELGSRSQEQYYRARDNVSHMVEEQPLMLGVLGMALGAAIGAAFPATRREDEMMGRTRDDLMDKAKETGRQQAETLKDSAKRVADSAKQEANRVAGQAQSSTQGQGDGRSSSATGTATTTTPTGTGSTDTGRPSIH